MIRPGDADPILMNARKKEKKKLLTQAIKPSRASEWEALGQDWLKWVKTNEYSMNIHDYPIAMGYPPYKFKKEWAKESSIFRDYLEQCVYICAQRRDRYMDSKDKLYLQILKQLPQYDWEYKDIEDERVFKESLVDEVKWTTIIAPVQQTEKLDEFIKKQKEKTAYL